jgi:outer membrane protein TolC
MTRKFYNVFALLITIAAYADAQTLTLDSCRALAIANNKELLISNEKINSAYYQHKAAKTNYLPKLSAEASYLHNQKEVSILNDKQKNALNGIGTTFGTSAQQTAASIAAKYPDLAPMISSLGSTYLPTISTSLNSLGTSIVDAFRTDTRNMYGGALTLIQPLFMGGKIVAYDHITQYAEELARQQHEMGMQDVILSVDQAYWQVVSLVNKKKLAEGYLKLLNTLDHDIDRLITNGFATKADGLSVKVKVNEAEMMLTKVEDGLSLSKMLLCQICGLNLSAPIHLADEDIDNLSVVPAKAQYNVQTAYDNRPELKSLELATKIYDEKVKVTRADYLPQLSLIGNYLVTNPSTYNGFEKKFKGMWNVGVMFKMPIWNWGEGSYKVRQAKAEANITRYQLSDAREKIELQVNQSADKVNEAIKRYNMATKNMEKANENLRYANVGFKEGVIPASNVLEAHTAWLQAQSEKIDAEVDIKLTNIYLQKSLGILR